MSGLDTLTENIGSTRTELRDRLRDIATVLSDVHVDTGHLKNFAFEELQKLLASTLPSQTFANEVGPTDLNFHPSGVSRLPSDLVNLVRPHEDEQTRVQAPDRTPTQTPIRSNQPAGPPSRTTLKRSKVRRISISPSFTTNRPLELMSEGCLLAFSQRNTVDAGPWPSTRFRCRRLDHRSRPRQLSLCLSAASCVTTILSNEIQRGVSLRWGQHVGTEPFCDHNERPRSKSPPEHQRQLLKPRNTSR